jgi:hypothetical protein
VQQFLSQGVSSAESNELVTDDFKWIGPASLDFMFEGDVSYLDKQAAAIAPLPRRGDLQGVRQERHRIVGPFHDR